MTALTRLRDVDARVGGESLALSGSYEVVDPYTEQVLADVPDCSPADVQHAVAVAADAAPTWARTPLDTRRRVLAHAAEQLAAQTDELVDVAVRDAGTGVELARRSQVDAAIERLRQWARRGPELLELASPSPHPTLDGRVRRIPVGVVGCISPYNFPLLAMVGKVAPALFAGNTVVMKPAPQDPILVHALTLALENALRTEGAPPGAINLVTGAGPDPGAALVDDLAVGAISFTGSTVVGTEIYRAAAPGMKRLLLELGGKGALIIRADADLDAAVAAAVRTWTRNAGQVCLTPARVLVDASVHDAVVDRLLDVLTGLTYGDPRNPDTRVTPLITEVQRLRVAALVDSARAEGATVHQRGVLPERGFFHPATLVTDCRPDLTVMQEEAFGPVLAVMATTSDDEAVAVANSTRYALSDYVFSADRDAGEAIATQLRAAQVGINTGDRHPDLPFGGNRASGLGRSGSAYALDVYTDLQAIASPRPGAGA